MQRRWLALFVAACADDTLDLAPDPIDWTDFANQSTSQKITGIDEEISVTLREKLGSDSAGNATSSWLAKETSGLMRPL